MSNTGLHPTLRTTPTRKLEPERRVPGQQVTVYYDPTQPDVAVLEPSNRQGSLAPLVFGAIFAIGGAVLLAFFMNVGFVH